MSLSVLMSHLAGMKASAGTRVLAITKTILKIVSGIVLKTVSTTAWAGIRMNFGTTGKRLNGTGEKKNVGVR